jgi:hypothetical protein
VVVPAGAEKAVELNADKISLLIIHQPKLWWPNGYGKANLYQIRMQYSEGNAG